MFKYIKCTCTKLIIFSGKIPQKKSQKIKINKVKNSLLVTS